MAVALYTCERCDREKPQSDFIYRRGRGNNYSVCKQCEKLVRMVVADKFPEDRSDPRAGMLERSKVNAQLTSCEHRLTLDDIPVPTTCKYLGVTLKYRSTEERPSYRDPCLASLDRIDSSKGYVPGNVQVISLKANVMKSNATVEELITFALGVLKHHGAG